MDNKHYNILDFVKTGKIDGIYVGMPRVDLLNTVNANLISECCFHDFILYYYKCYEFIVTDNVVTMIMINRTLLYKTCLYNNNIKYNINKKTSINKLLELFSSMNIDWKFDMQYTYEKNLSILTNGGVYFLFDCAESTPTIEKIGK